MGGKKAQQPAAPVPANSYIIQDGNQIGSNVYNKDTNSYTTTYTATPEEQAAKLRRQTRQSQLEGEIAAFQPKLNVFDEGFQTDMNNVYNAYVNDQTKKFEDQWNPEVQKVKNQNLQRFGTTNNSIFDNQMKQLNKIHASTLQDIINQATLGQTNLKQTELSNRANYLSSLQNEDSMLGQGLDSYLNSAKLGYASSANSSNMLNQFDTDVYGKKMAAYLQEQQQRAGLMQGLFGALGGGLKFFG